MAYWGQEAPLIEHSGHLQTVDAHVTATVWIKETIAFALGDGTVLLSSAETQDRILVHEGACLAAMRLGNKLITCGDDGRVQEVDPSGRILTRLNEFGRFFDQLATAEWGGIAVSDAKRIYVLFADGKKREYRSESSVGGLAFAPKGRKLAASRNNGVDVYWVGTDRDAPDKYEWRGAHGLVCWSPRGDFLVTSMHENALHVWRTDHAKHGRMGGYPARIKSVSWDQRGTSLATSGSDSIVLWSFHSKEGPIGKPANQIPLKTDVLLNAVAFHPKYGDILAVGTQPGDVLLMRTDGAILPVAYETGSAITALSFNEDGSKLAFGTDQGVCGLVSLQELPPT